MSAIIEVRGVIKDYPLGKLKVRALHGIDLVVDRGEFTTIAGPSGSGKTTLLNLIGCVDVPPSNASSLSRLGSVTHSAFAREPRIRLASAVAPPTRFPSTSTSIARTLFSSNDQVGWSNQIS